MHGQNHIKFVLPVVNFVSHVSIISYTKFLGGFLLCFRLVLLGCAAISAYSRTVVAEIPVYVPVY